MSYRSPKTEKAARMDEDGNFNEALILLSAASGEGDLDALTLLGRRLLLGDRAPRMPKEGAHMLLEAAQKDHVVAVATMAILQCLGIQQKKNWQDALASIIHAACLGWEPARQQLLILSPEQVETDALELIKSGPASLWQQLGRSIDINKWLNLPAGNLLSESPMVVSFSDFLTPDLCQFFMVQARQNLQPAWHADPANMRNPNALVASNSISQIGLADNEFIHLLVQERMSRACGMPQDQMEGMSILHYLPGQEFSSHGDFFDPADSLGQQEITSLGQRNITFLIYLNDDYEGGETHFTELDIMHKGKAGEALYFVNVLPDGSGDQRTLHAGKTPATGEKWLLSQYIRDRSLNFMK